MTHPVPRGRPDRPVVTGVVVVATARVELPLRHRIKHSTVKSRLNRYFVDQFGSKSYQVWLFEDVRIFFQLRQFSHRFS